MMKSKQNDHECTECPKSFPSEKALHGHMRLHPRRSWRGMQRPNPPATSLPPLLSWTVTAKRGRTTTITTTGSSSTASTSGTSSAGSELAVNDITLVQQYYYTEHKKSATKKIKIQLRNLNHSTKLYRCNSCDKEFSSHQALGGHKSNRNKSTTVSGSSTDDRQLPSTQRRKVLDFDLNELPPMDEDHEATQFS